MTADALAYSLCVAGKNKMGEKLPGRLRQEHLLRRMDELAAGKGAKFTPFWQELEESMRHTGKIGKAILDKYDADSVDALIARAHIDDRARAQLESYKAVIYAEYLLEEEEEENVGKGMEEERDVVMVEGKW